MLHTGAYLEIRGISKAFRDGRGNRVTAVDRLSLQIDRGEFVTLIGPSGCGKTTTLRIVSGMEHADSGDILLEGKSLAGIPPQQRNMPMVFQSYALFPHMTVFDNIAYGLRTRGMTANAIAHDVALASQMVDLAGVEHRYPGELSGGQQQRVALARALVLKPRIILFDEPLSNLDPRLRTQTRRAIRRVQELLGITILYVTHDQSEALSLSDRVVIMNHGRLIQEGHPRDVYHTPVSPFVADFIANATFLDGVVESADDTSADVRILGQLYRVSREQIQGTPEVGQDLLVAVIPETVFLHTDTGRGELTGSVEAVAFTGPLTEYTVGCGDTWITAVRAERNSTGVLHPLETGDPVAISLDSSTFRLYRTDP